MTASSPSGVSTLRTDNHLINTHREASASLQCRAVMQKRHAWASAVLLVHCASQGHTKQLEMQARRAAAAAAGAHTCAATRACSGYARNGDLHRACLDDRHVVFSDLWKVIGACAVVVVHHVTALTSLQPSKESESCSTLACIAAAIARRTSAAAGCKAGPLHGKLQRAAARSVSINL